MLMYITVGRTYHASFFMRSVKRWVQEHLPYWNRSQGKDHIFLALVRGRFTKSILALTVLEWGPLDACLCCLLPALLGSTPLWI